MEEISGESGWAAEQGPPAPAQPPTGSGPPPSSGDSSFPAPDPYQPPGPYSAMPGGPHLAAPVHGAYQPPSAAGPFPPGPYSSGPATGPIPVVPPNAYPPGPATGPIPVVPPNAYPPGPGTGPIPVVPPDAYRAGPYTGPGTGPIPVVPPDAYQPGPYTGPGTGPIPVVPPGPYPGQPGPYPPPGGQFPGGPGPYRPGPQGPGPQGPGPGPYGPPPGGPYGPPQPGQGPGPQPPVPVVPPSMRQTAPQQALTPTTVRLAGSDTGGRARPRRYRRKITLTVLAAIVFAGVAAGAGYYAHTESSGTPTASERAAAAATGLAQRWERVTAGTLFPQHVPYTTDLLNREAASRLGIGLATSCTAALDQTLSGLAAHYGCGTALRASYADALGGTVYTVGVLAFPSPSAAGTFYARIPVAQSPGAGLRPLALAGTASARFTDAARQSSLARQTGPYVILVVAGYADGRPAAATGERRPPVFAPAAKLAGAVVTPLSVPSVVNCKDTTEWAC